MTELFDVVATRQTEALSMKSGSANVTRVVHSLPFFEGNVSTRRKVKGSTDRLYVLNAAYIINVYSCIAQSIVDCGSENIENV